MTTAFQPGAFQSDAFQIDGGTTLTAEQQTAFQQNAFQSDAFQIFGGVVSFGGISGSVNYTNNNDTLAASGTTTIVGFLARTNNNDTLSATGTTTVVGTSNTTSNNDTLAASGTTGSATGAVAYTNNNDTCASEASVGEASGGKRRRRYVIHQQEHDVLSRILHDAQELEQSYYVTTPEETGVVTEAEPASQVFLSRQKELSEQLSKVIGKRVVNLGKIIEAVETLLAQIDEEETALLMILANVEEDVQIIYG